MEPDEELDPVLARAVAVLKGAPSRPLSATFTNRVIAAALPAQASPVSVLDPVRRLMYYLFRPRMMMIRPAWSLAAAMLICAVAAGGTWWGTRAVAPSANVLVRFAVSAPGAQSVALAGDFNGWETEDIRLADPEGDGVWQAVVPLTPGVYQYMFVLDGETWISDPLAGDKIDDGFGQQNSLVRIATSQRRIGGKYREL